MTTTAPQGPSVVTPPDAATRLDLYRTMVLARTFEEAILREYHADKGPGFDIGKGLIPGEMHLSAGQEPVAAGVCAHLTTDDAVTATHRPHHFAIAHGVDLRPDDRRDLRPRDRPRPRPGRAHAPVRPGDALLLLGHHRRGLPAGARAGVRLPAPGHRPGRGRRHRRGRRQPGRRSTSRSTWPRCGSCRSSSSSRTTTGASRCRATRPPPIAVQRRPRARRTACRASGSRTTTSRRSTTPPGGRSPGPAPARARRLLEVHTLRLWGHFEGDAQGYRPELAEVPGHDPIPAYEAGCATAGVLDDAPVAAGQGGGASAGSRTAIAFAKAQPAARPGRRPRRTCSPEGDADDHHRDAGARPRQPPAHHRQGDGRGHRAGDGARPVGLLPGRGRRRVRRHLRLHHRPARPVRAGPDDRHPDLRDRVHRRWPSARPSRGCGRSSS